MGLVKRPDVAISGTFTADDETSIADFFRKHLPLDQWVNVSSYVDGDGMCYVTAHGVGGLHADRMPRKAKKAWKAVLGGKTVTRRQRRLTYRYPIYVASGQPSVPFKTKALTTAHAKRTR